MFEQAKELLVTRFRVPETQILGEATLHDLELDPLDTVELAQMVFDEFGSRITDDELLELERLDLIVELLESRVGQP